MDEPIAADSRASKTMGAVCAVWLLASPVFAGPDADALEHLVIQDCGSCHGLTLKGGLGPAITPEALEGAELGDLTRMILDGAPERAMPGWRALLSEEDADWIARYLLKGERP